MSTRTLLNHFNLPEYLILDGMKFRPTDLTSKKVVFWLINNLHIANRNHPALSSTKQALNALIHSRRRW